MSLELSQSFGIGKENAPPLEEVETKVKDNVVRDRIPNYHYIALVLRESADGSLAERKLESHCIIFLGGKGDFCFLMYVIQHCLICRPSDFTVSEDRTQDCCDFGIASQTLSTWLDLIHHLARSHPPLG
jgi:hypothetical protein